MVLQRKHWIIKGSQLKILANESDFNYYYRINIWRKQKQIPDKVFITIGNGKRREEGLSPDDYKPQYIDFSNPVFLPLITKLFKKSDEIKMAELLPVMDDALKFGASKYTAEFLVQWYNGKNFI